MLDINFTICTYIYNQWILKAHSQRAFALDHNIEESMVRKIKNTALQRNKNSYQIPVLTLKKICEARNLKLHDFFKLINA